MPGVDFTPTNGTLSVVAGYALTSTNITFNVSGSSLSLTWPGSHLGWYAQSNAVDLALTNYWFVVPGSTNTNRVIITINPSLTSVIAVAP